METGGRTEQDAVAALEEVLPGACPLEAVVNTDVRPVALAHARDVADHPVRVQVAVRASRSTDSREKRETDAQGREHGHRDRRQKRLVHDAEYRDERLVLRLQDVTVSHVTHPQNCRHRPE